MKKSLLILVALFSIISANAQSYLGFYHDNYAGVQSVLFNPASIVDSRFKTDINLFSFSTAIGNDMYAVNFSDAFKSGYDFDTQAKKSFTSSNNVIMNLDLMGPAFMFNITPKQTLAIYTRARTFVNLGGVNGELINELSKEDGKNDFSYTLGNPNFIGNSWGEFGLSYAAVLYQKGQHFLKGGFTAKYLQGIANAHFKGDGINLEYVEDMTNPGSSTFSSTGDATYGTSQDFDANPNIEIDSASKGFGLDLGVVYEWRPDFDTTKKEVSNFKELNKYKLRFGLSLTDLGSIKYEKGIRRSYDLNNTVTQADFDNANNFDTFLSNNYPETVLNAGVKSKLPTAFHADVDWNMCKKIYLNVNGDFSLIDNTTLNQNSIENRFSVTPRFESKWLSFYLPVSFMQYSGTQIGAGLRTGIFFIGSGSAITNVFKESKAMDFHLGIKISVYQKKSKDTDGDGVYDIVDGCPKVSGLIENNGCPWEDKDGDTVLDKDDSCADLFGPVENKGCPWGDKDGDSIYDKDDSCVYVAGPVENKGCPWEDSDKDSILDKDDKCPTVAGLKENNGCPLEDTDGDSVIDKDDKCPTIKGLVSNSGCPVVDTAVLKKLNDYAKSILFDSGKSTIKAESIPNLDEIVKVMNEYGSANFKLEGYTDNTGVEASNLQLSKDRAVAVKGYLISNGISSERLSSEGYGIEKPISDNKTLAGRALNRRIEIIVTK